MKKFSLLALITAIIFSFTFLTADPASAAIKDGTYSVPYTVKHSDGKNASIADGYFSKPATLTVSGGTQTIQITLTGAEMIKSLSVDGTPVTVVSDNGETRVVKFNVSGDLSRQIPMNMHIVVPGMYDTNHGAKLDLVTKDLPAAGSQASTNNNTNTSSGSGEKVVENPKTSDNSPIVLYAVLLVGAAGALILVRKLRPSGN